MGVKQSVNDTTDILLITLTLALQIDMEVNNFDPPTYLYYILLSDPDRWAGCSGTENYAAVGKVGGSPKNVVAERSALSPFNEGIN